jgi:hypothetical protein
VVGRIYFPAIFLPNITIPINPKPASAAGIAYGAVSDVLGDVAPDIVVTGFVV